MTPEYQATDKCLAESDEAGHEAMKRWRGGAAYFQADIARACMRAGNGEI
ncbi:MAG: hypothetical protein ABI583_04235 [Betaproteobacteria bacterium]